ncbi:ArsR/SmtB family transcription factor [Bacillus wiedmannii]|uniref:ArsR/SmtB family transcription factor n=1 Tax=Bacillus wiedmannii TaxID=1890302 RepID=UPI000BEF3C77|nr:metalloregulator ArsR/SmtB family transcription factor [Bacillus wiedmannii]PEO40890.1 transcriptional regulator [Bacillus wiedmannii]
MSKSVNVDSSDYETSADILRALANPMRLRIVKKLIEMCSLNVSQIQNMLGFPQSTTSIQLMRLRQYKIVVRERKGSEVYYSVDDSTVIGIIKTLGL